MNIILIGPQGSGKGTQAKLLTKKYDLVHISTGDLIREGVARGDPSALKIKEFVDKGQLAPDEFIMNLIRQAAEGKDALFDGIPRTLEQAHSLDEIAHIDQVIEIKLSDEEAVSRLSQRKICIKCGTIYGKNETAPETCPCGGKPAQRDDDKPEAIKKRLEVYHEQTEPLLEYYKPRDIVHSVNGDKAVEEVFKQICLILE